MPKVVIQAGHQNIGSNVDPGLRSGTGAPGEASFTVDIANQVSAALRARGFTVKQTDANANADTSVTQADWDLFLAIHYDANGYNNDGGFVAIPDPSVDAAHDQSQRIAQQIEKTYFPITGIRDFSVWQTTNTPYRDNPNTKYYYMWSVLSAKTPCVLIECGVGWRVPKDSDVLNSTTGRPKVVEGIVRGICNAFNVPYDLPSPKPVDPLALVSQIRTIVYNNLSSTQKIAQLKKLLP